MRMPPEQARSWFAGARVARLGTVDEDGRPHLVPVTFAVLTEPDRVVVAVDHKPKSTTALKRLANLRRDDRATYLVDHYDDADWSALWWVRADCRSRVLSAPTREALAALVAKYPPYDRQPPSGPLIESVVDSWTGWSASE